MGLFSAFAIYLLILLAIGLLAYRKQTSSEEFVLGGRSLNFYVAALSAHASDMSSWLFMAYPSLIFLGGGVKIWTAVGLLSGMFAAWQFLAPRLRKETERLGAVTLSAYFTERFGDGGGILRLLGSGLSLLFFTVYVSAGFVGLRNLFDVIFGIDPLLGMTIAAGAVLLYTAIGGFNSICWIDLFQGIFLLGAVVVVPLYAGAKINWAGLDVHNWSPFSGGVWGAIVASFGWGLGYFGQTHVLTKFMGIKNPSEIPKAKWLGISWQTLALGAGTLVGIVATGYFALDTGNPELVFVRMVKELFHPFMAGLILCGVFAATISTMDSQIIVLVGVLSEDIYHHLLRRKARGRETAWVSRFATLLVVVAAYLVALFSGKNVLGLVYYSWSGLGSVFGPVLIMGLWHKGTNRHGAIAGMVFGGLVSAFWPWTGLGEYLPALIPGFLLNLLVIYGVSHAYSPDER